MSKTIRVARPAPPSPTHLSDFDARRPKHPRLARPSSLALIGAATSFAAACLLGGGACSIALGNPAPTDLPCMATIAGALACAAGLLGLGLLFSLRERDLRKREIRLTTRAERVRQELDALGLTPRETTIAELILQHRSYADIAACCHLSPRTVQFHASNIYRKAFVTQRRQFEHLMLVDGLQRESAPYKRIARIRPDEADEDG